MVPHAVFPAASSPTGNASEIATQVISSGRLHFRQTTDASSEVPLATMCAPLKANRGILGALYISAVELNDPISFNEQELFEAIALQAAAAIDHALVYQSAITDPLTQLFCHRHFQQEVEQCVRRARRTETPLTLIMMDLDHFKALNDTCGHSAGNDCLKQVAEVLRSTLRLSDTIARFGGDEFEILLQDTKPFDGFAIAEKIRLQIGALVFQGGRRVAGTFGVATFPANAGDAQSLFLRADAALYEAKEGGRNRTVISGAVAITTSRDPEKGSVAGRTGVEGEPRAAALNLKATEHKVDGHEVIRRLGSGSTGEILLVRQPELERDVALKRPLQTLPNDTQLLEFEHEAKLTASLNHPGIIPIYTMGRDTDSRRYYTMKPLDGVSLREVLQRRRTGDRAIARDFTNGRLLEILQRVSEAIAYAHRRQTSHLDLNPGNVMVGDFGEVAVIDWGTTLEKLRQNCRQFRRPGEISLLGSPSYIAPEVLGEKPLERAMAPGVDVYALGGILYEILAGWPPHVNATVGTFELIRRILEEDPAPPEQLAPLSGVDPLLSSLALKALDRNPKRRPSALEFFHQLNKFNRRDPEWSLIEFGKDHPVKSDEWEVVLGKWRLEGDCWVAENSEDSVLVWSTLVPGSFRFECEVWSDAGCELALIGHAPHKNFKNYNKYDGYYFEFGADGNSCTKLARNRHDVLARPDLRVTPGRHYRLQIEWNEEDGLFYGAIDNQNIFEYKELFSFPGAQIGLYSHGPACFRPIAVHQRDWTLQIPALRVADRYLQQGHFSEALELYDSISAKVPQRLEGIEARLKYGSCLASLNRADEARSIYQTLQTTVLAPFALEEQALLDFSREDGDRRRGLHLFRQLRERYPMSQARTHVFDALDSLRKQQHGIKMNYSEHIQTVVGLAEMAANSSSPPTQSQISAQFWLLYFLMREGKWTQARDSNGKYKKSLTPFQSKQMLSQVMEFSSAFAIGVEPSNVDFASILWTNHASLPYYRDLTVNYLAAPGNADSFIRRPPPVHAAFTHWRDLIKFQALLIKNDAAGARTWLSETEFDSILLRLDDSFTLLMTLLHWGDRAAIGGVIQRYYSRDDLYPQLKSMVTLVKGRFELERGNFEGAARNLTGLGVVEFFRMNDAFVLRALLTSMGYLNECSPAEMLKLCQFQLSGTELVLAEIFFRRQAAGDGRMFSLSGVAA